MTLSGGRSYVRRIVRKHTHPSATSLRNLTSLVVAACVLALAGCGGGQARDTPRDARKDGPEAATVASTSRQKDSARTRREEALKLQRARARSRARAVAGVVPDYYRKLDAKDLDPAWARSSPGVQAQLGSDDTWAASQDGNRLGLAHEGAHRASVEVGSGGRRGPALDLGGHREDGGGTERTDSRSTASTDRKSVV